MSTENEKLSLTVPYLGFESNFHFFTCPILGARYNLGMKQPDNLPDELLLHLGYRGRSTPPCGVQGKPYDVFNNAASRNVFGNTTF